MSEMVASRAELDISRDTSLRIYRKMLLIRAFEERARELFQSGRLPRHGHLYAGQEAVAAAAMVAIGEDDFVTATHRGHGVAIGRTEDLKGAMAEISGKEAGFCHGKGGTMHIADFSKAMLGAFPIVGASIPMAVGGGLAARTLGAGQLSVAFFGDGASNQGTFHEGLNLAAIWDLPVIFICENNLYGVFTDIRKVARVEDIATRAAGYGIPGVVVDGMNPLAVYRAVTEAAERARAGQGPTLIEAKTYRWGGHHTGDPGTGYRSREEVEEWKARDPIPAFRASLLEAGLLSEEEASAVESGVAMELEEAVSFALSAPEPPVAAAFEDLFAPEYRPEVTVPEGEARELTSLQALTEAIGEEMESNPRLLTLGYDLGPRGGSFGVTKGLLDRFGPERVIDTPISENGYVAASIGAALAGVPTIVEVSFMDFSTLALDPIVNVAAKAHYMSGGQQRCPVVIRTQEGGGAGGGATHSQCLEAWFTHVPGLKVVLPSTPYDYKGLLKSAIREPNPVVFIEHKMLYRIKGSVPSGEYAIPLGVADVKREGRDLTVVAWGAMVPRALAAAETLAGEGIQTEVIDPRTLVPLDLETMVASVKKTGRLVVFQEAYVGSSFGAEVARAVGKAAFDYLEAPIEVVGTVVPLPFSPPLEAAVLPGEGDLVAAVRVCLGKQ